jgi:hypothetical protein
METELQREISKLEDEKEAYKAGFRDGCTTGQVGTLNRADIETNAAAHYEEWRKKKDKEKK